MNGMLVLVQKGNVIFEKYYKGHGPDDVAFHLQRQLQKR